MGTRLYKWARRILFALAGIKMTKGSVGTVNRGKGYSRNAEVIVHCTFFLCLLPLLIDRVRTGAALGREQPKMT